MYGPDGDVVKELERVSTDLRRLQALDLDPTIKLMLRLLQRLVKQLKSLAAKRVLDSKL